MEEEIDVGMYKDERWLPVVGYEGWYDVSDFGRVRSARTTTNTYAGRVLKLATNFDYKLVTLYRDGNKHTHRVHRLVIAAFVGPRPDGKEVNHIDGDKANNMVENLEYVTSSENKIHAYDTGLASNQGERHPSNKLVEKDVHKIRRFLSKGLTRRAIASLFNVNRSTISAIADGRSWAYLKEEGEE